MKSRWCVVLLLSAYGGGILANNTDTTGSGRIGIGRYVAGGVVGTALGLGIGHAIQGRYWRDYGWAFTVGTIALVLSEESCDRHYNEQDAEEVLRHKNCQADRTREWRRTLPTFLGLKAVEAIAVWWPRNVNFGTPPHPSLPSNPIPVSKQRYLWGGVLGTVVGFGAGHAVQGRWLREGWKYSAWQAGVASLFAYSLFDEYFPDTGLWALLLVGSKIAEISDVWDQNPSIYRVVGGAQQSPSLVFTPLLSTERMGVRLVMRI